MEESDRAEEEKRPTKAVTSEPQEEFIEPVPRPSRPEESSSLGGAEQK